MCLGDDTDSGCCSATSTNWGSHSQTQINKEKRLHGVAPPHSSEIANTNIFTSCHTTTARFETSTKDTSYVTEECLRYAQARVPHGLKDHILRSTLRMNARINPTYYSVRLLHNQSSSEDPRQTVRDESPSVPDGDTEAQLTHTDAQGRATMVDVGGKVPSCRTAKARATVILGPTAYRLLRDNQLVKGDALTVAQLAGIMASKQTSALIPLCHPLPLDHVSITFHLDETHKSATITATCRTTGRTGVEMEALTAVSVAALTIYDMCKAVSHDIVITDVKLVSKTGGKKDFHRCQTQDKPE